MSGAPSKIGQRLEVITFCAESCSRPLEPSYGAKVERLSVCVILTGIFEACPGKRLVKYNIRTPMGRFLNITERQYRETIEPWP